MSSLPTQPYTVVDFSGGLTENFIGGGPTRYMAADNFWITVDKKLEERYGSMLLDSVNFQLPSGTSPVNALLTHDNEAFLLGVACPNIYVLNPNWAGILGPTGNPPLAGGNYLNSISSGEWSHHTLMTNDSLATPPVKIYRGAAYPIQMTSPTVQASPQVPPSAISGFTAVTAGLPGIAGTSIAPSSSTTIIEPSPFPNSTANLVGKQNISDTTLLANCIALANAIYTQLSAHMLDYGGVPGYNSQLHSVVDSPDLATLTSTGGLCTNQATMFALVGAIANAFNGHVSDAINSPSAPSYHYPTPTGFNSPLNFFPNSLTAPTTLITAAAMLDDLKTKFFMHQMSPFQHDQYNLYSLTSRYLVTVPHIGTISTGPIATPSYANSIALVNQLRTQYNLHCADTTTDHINSDVNDSITFPPAVDLDSLYVLIVLLRAQYVQHILDSAMPHWSVTGTATAGSNTITSVSSVPTESTGFFIASPQFILYDVSAVWWSPNPVYITSSGSGTLTMSRNSLNNGTFHWNATQARYHVAANTNLGNEQLGTGGSGQFLSYTPTPSNLAAYISLLTTCCTAFNAHDADGLVHITTPNNTGIYNFLFQPPTVGSYYYAIHYFYQYMRYDGVVFNVVGPPAYTSQVFSETASPTYTTAVQGTQVSTGNIYYLPITTLATPVTLSNIPTLQNGGQGNYDTANAQVKVYRTINAGSTFYSAGILTNGVSSYSDSLPDSSNPLLPAVVPLQQQTTMYTSGGVVNFDPAPVCKYLTILNNTAYYGGIIDTGQTFLNRVRQSISNNIDSSPGSFFIDMPDVVTGLSNTRNNLIVFCANSTYQVTGAFTQTGQGQMSAVSISDTIGCVSNASIARTDVGIFFAGTDGFYYTDGFQLIKLSSELNLTYAALVSNAKQKAAIYGCYDRYNRRVWWTTQPNPSDWSATQSYIFHVNFGVTANGVFTTASNFENYRPSSMIFWQGRQIRGDARGYLFLHSVLSKTDPQINIKTTATAWNTVCIPYNYSSCAMDFGTTFNRKWLTRMSVQGKNVGNVGASILSVSDNGRVTPMALAPVWFKPNISWGQPGIIWGAPNYLQPIVWGATQQMDMWRRFPATQLRADYKQITITPAKIGVYRYQDWPVGSAASITPGVSGTASIQMITPPGFTAVVWPSDVVGYVFATQLDGYVKEYSITALSTTTNTNDTLTVADPNNILISTKVAWIIRGKLKQQRLSLTSYVIHFTLLGKMQQSYKGIQDSGENALGTIYAGGTQQDLTDDSGNPLTDGSGNPLTS